MKQAKDVDSYIASCPEKIQNTLTKLRRVIKKAAPNALERISYGMPFYEYGGKGYKGRLIYFAAFRNHISLFIPPSKDKLPKGLEKYHDVKATYHFPLDEPFPFSLIEKTVEALVLNRDKTSLVDV